MSIEKLSPGDNPPSEINVVIEIPMHGSHVKYEYDKSNDIMCVDRFMHTAMFYPANYGFIPNTKSGDGDPVDVLVISGYPVIPGVLVKARTIGVLLMEDESGQDEKIIAVPGLKVDPSMSHIHDIEQIDAILKQRIVHFFERYKDLEQGKWVKVGGWGNAEEAKQIINNALVRNTSPLKF